MGNETATAIAGDIHSVLNVLVIFEILFAILGVLTVILLGEIAAHLGKLVKK